MTKNPPSKTEPCFQCDGTGKMTITVVTGIGGKPETSKLECIECNGKKTLPKGSKAAREKAEKEFWCHCDLTDEDLGGIIFHDDGECRMCDKHHYHCPQCGKITQVG